MPSVLSSSLTSSPIPVSQPSVGANEDGADYKHPMITYFLNPWTKGGVSPAGRGSPRGRACRRQRAKTGASRILEPGAISPGAVSGRRWAVVLLSAFVCVVVSRVFIHSQTMWMPQLQNGREAGGGAYRTKGPKCLPTFLLSYLLT